VGLSERSMIDRQKVEAILSCRFPGAPRAQLAAAANALMGLPDEWEEVPSEDWDLLLTGEHTGPHDVRVFRRREY
jgi:hypothetical protein